MKLIKIEIECPECGRVMIFCLDTRIDEINLDESECDICGKKILANLEFGEV